MASLSPSEAEFAAYNYYDGSADSTEAFPGYRSSSASDGAEDNPDGCDFPGFSFVKVVKRVVLHLLVSSVAEFRKETCYGCQISHPSQREHECLQPTGDFFLLSNYRKIYHRVLNDRFTEAVRRVLAQHFMIRYPHSHSVVRGIAEALLYELKYIRNMDDDLPLEIQRTCIGGGVQTSVLKDAEKFWNGEDDEVLTAEVEAELQKDW